MKIKDLKKVILEEPIVIYINNDKITTCCLNNAFIELIEDKEVRELKVTQDPSCEFCIGIVLEG